MPTLLKKKTSNSPGIISFTHNEALWGVSAKYPKIRNLLIEKSAKNEWIFGVHIQGDCNFLEKWPQEQWQSFYLWPNKNEKYLKNIDPSKILPYTCVNFLKKFNLENSKKTWDLCIISRPSEIKRIKETLLIVRELMNLNKDLTCLFIVPDPRKINEGENTYKINKIDKTFFNNPLKFFNAEELKNLSFISTSQNSFGKFPIQDHLVSTLLSQSKFLFLYSHKEGVPRVIGESLMSGTPCIVSKNLKSGLNNILNETNTLFIDDNLEIATKQIHNAILNYKNYNFDKKVINSIFSYNENIDKFKKDLSKLFIQNDLEDPKDWIFNDLPQRLACHGMKNNYQLMNNDKLFLKWFNKIDNFENVTDLFFDDMSDFTDYESINFRNYKYILRKKISNIYFIYILRKLLLKIFKN